MRRRAGAVAVGLLVASALSLLAVPPASDSVALTRLCAWVADPSQALELPPSSAATSPGWPLPGAEVRACWLRAGGAPEALTPEGAAAALAALVPNAAFLARLREAARAGEEAQPLDAGAAACRAFLDCLADGAPGTPAGSPAALPAPLRAEFERLCAQTDSAASLSAAELAELIAAADRLETQLAPLTTGEARIVRQRLRRCRELFDYLRALREAKESAPPPT